MAETLGTAELILTADATRLQAGLQAGRQSVEQYNRSTTASFERAGRAQLNTLDGINARLNQLRSQRGGAVIGSAQFKALSAEIAELDQQARRASGGIGSFGGQVAGLAGQMGIAVSATGALLYAFDQIKAADDAGAAVRTLGVNSEELRSKLSDLSRELDGSVSTLDLLKASYDVASSGFADAASATDILRASAAGAKGGFADINEVAKATTAVLNAYGMSSAEAARVVDGFVQAQADGVLTVRQYADNIGEIVSVASAAGITIEELNAAIATATLKGVQVNQAFTGFRQVISSILKPSKEATDLATSLGIDYSLAGLQAKGFAGFLQDVAAKTGAAADKTAILLGSVEAQAALQPLLNDQLAKYNELLEKQAEKTGVAAKASNVATETISGNITKIQNKLSNLVLEYSSTTNTALGDTLSLVNDTLTALEKLGRALPKGQQGGARNEILRLIGATAPGAGPGSIGTIYDVVKDFIRRLFGEGQPPQQQQSKPQEGQQPQQGPPVPPELQGSPFAIPQAESDAFWSRVKELRQNDLIIAKEQVKIATELKSLAGAVRSAAQSLLEARQGFAGAVGQAFAIATNEQRLRARQINEERIRAAERSGAFDPARVATRYGLEQTGAGLNLQSLTFRQLERLAGEVGTLANAETNLQTAMTANTTALQELAKRKWEVQVNVRNNANGTTAVDYVNNLR